MTKLTGLVKPKREREVWPQSSQYDQLDPRMGLKVVLVVLLLLLLITNKSFMIKLMKKIYNSVDMFKVN